MPPAGAKARPRVVILGGGFAGVGAAKKLVNADVDVVIVDKNDYHSFQPLLYQVATGLLDTPTIAHSLRDLFHGDENVTVRQATVSAIDRENRRVEFAGLEPLTYDYLVLALGARVNFFGVEGAAAHAFPLYTVADALRLKQHVLRQWESADRDRALVEDGALNVVIVGGGPTGVESAGAMAELYTGNLTEDFPGLPAEHARVTLVEAGPALLAMFKRDIQEYTVRALKKRGVEVLLGESVSSIEPTRVTLASGQVLNAHTLVWGAGLQASELAPGVGADLQRGNRIVAAPDLSLSEDPRVFPVGDVAWITDSATKEVLPQLGSVALQAGEQAGENISHLVAGEETKPFVYHDKGTMATIGRGAAVAQLKGGHTIKGRAAFLAWGAVHLALLSSGEDRAKALTDWTWAAFTHKRSARTAIDTTPAARV